MPAVPPGLRDAFFKLSHQGMGLTRRLSGGRLGTTMGGMPVVELHTTGRTTGRRRSIFITPPVRDGDRLVIVASKLGDDRDPDWYRNLVADPEVEVTMDGATRAMVARTATGTERDELWAQIVAAAPNYAGYEERTGREIPVVVLTAV
ncbi:MAG: nitroreductase/quinone reductase family protein [Desertimonas sp.]